jgi:hypothetical protein
MEIVKLKFIILLLCSFTFVSCESVVSYKGIVINTQKQPIKGVTILVQINDRIRESYGVEIPDTIHYLERDSINSMHGLELEKHLVNDKGQYVQFEPYKTDSTGYFNFILNEGGLFGQPNYKLIFKKDGFEDYEFLGNWKSDESLEIVMEELK